MVFLLRELLRAALTEEMLAAASRLPSLSVSLPAGRAHRLASADARLSGSLAPPRRPLALVQSGAALHAPQLQPLSVLALTQANRDQECIEELIRFPKN